MSLKTLFGLIVCNLIWSVNPAMGKIILTDISAPMAAWLRYSSALLAYLIYCLVIRPKKSFATPRSGSDWIWISVLGFLVFCMSPLLQMSGLAMSRATDNALIIAMEPLVAVLLASVFLREHLRRVEVIAFALALLGFGFLSELNRGMRELSLSTHSLGNIIMLLSLFGEASYSILGKKLIRRHEPSSLFGAALVMGVIFLTLGTGFLGNFPSPEEFTRFTWRSGLAALWLGPVGTAFTYLFWMHALVEASVVSISLTLFIQPVFGAFLGMIFLGERLSVSQMAGAALILAALVFQTALNARRKVI